MGEVLIKHYIKESGDCRFSVMRKSTKLFKGVEKENNR